MRYISTIQDIMIREVISVHEDTPILDAYKVILEHGVHGVPVVDLENRLVGILTEYDFIVKGSSLHLPTFQKIVSELNFNKKDRAPLQKNIDALANLCARDIMNRDPLTLPNTASVEDAVAAFRDHHRVNPIPVIDKNKKVVGVVSRFDVLKLFASLIHSP